jgi:protein TonB
MMDFYPESALARGLGGRVVLSCLVSESGKLDCQVIEETPEGKGFGRAAIQASSKFKVAPQTENGKPTSGGRLRVPIAFVPPKDG